MAKGFFKDNEKVLMTMLLLFIAPTFAFTGLASWWFGYGGGNAAYEIFGERVSYADVLEKRTELANSSWLQGVLNYGYLGGQQRRGANTENVLQAFMFDHEIEELDLELSDLEVQEVLRNAAISMIAWHQVFKNSGQFATLQDDLTQFNNIRLTTVFHSERYRQAILDPAMELGISVQEFESGVIRFRRRAKLIELVTSAAVVTEKEVYDGYLDQQQKRTFDIVSIGDQQFSEAALEEMDEEYFRKVYEDSPDDYKSPTRIQLEVARLVLASLRDDDYQPSSEEIEEYYEENKDLWKIPRPLNYVPPEDAQPEDDFRPITDVFEGIISRIRQDQAKEKEGEFLESALAAGKAHNAAGESFEMADLFGEASEFVEILTTGPFGNTEYSKLEQWMRNAAHLSPLFTDLRLDPNSFKPGTMSRAIVPGNQGGFIYRFVEIFPEAKMDFEEAKVMVFDDAQKVKAKELATEFVQEWIDSAPEGETLTLESFAADQNLTVFTSEPVGRNEGYKLRIDTKAPLAQQEILLDGFLLEEDGQLAGPVTNDRDPNVYVMSLKSIDSPDMVLYQAFRTSIEARIRREKQQVILDQYRADLSRKANIQVFNVLPQDPGQVPATEGADATDG